MKYEVQAPEENRSEIIKQSDLKAYKKKGYGVIRLIPENLKDKNYLNGEEYLEHEGQDD